MTDVVSIVDGLDLVVGLAQDHLHPDDLRAARTSSLTARSRVGHLGSTLVLALLGGTGAGKSSLLNAIAGKPVASTSPVRPHTTEPLAWIPDHAERALHTLLDRLEVSERLEQDRFPDLAILDMIDVDSLVFSHRRRVEQLLPSVDVAVWVFDPVKYADAVVHKDFIAPNAHAADRLIFVLNQVDLITEDERVMMRDHLVDLLVADGIEQPIVFEVAADPAEGVPIGIDALVDHLGGRLDEKLVHLGRIIEDIRRTARDVAGAMGIATSGPLDFERRWDEFRTQVASRLAVDGPSVAVYEEALRSLDQLVLRLSIEAGGPYGTRIRQTFEPDRLDDELRGSVEAMEQRIPRGGSGTSLDPGRRAEAVAILDAQLQARIGSRLREILWERASLAAAVAGLAVDATMAESDLLGMTIE
ncbi:MAG TPA: GTPase [Acidimicrobiia bacterium]|nr:GTPase [Acidimicrobiia bacterium]